MAVTFGIEVTLPASGGWNTSIAVVVIGMRGMSIQIRTKGGTVKQGRY